MPPRTTVRQKQGKTRTRGFSLPPLPYIPPFIGQPYYQAPPAAPPADTQHSVPILPALPSLAGSASVEEPTQAFHNILTLPPAGSALVEDRLQVAASQIQVCPIS